MFAEIILLSKNHGSFRKNKQIYYQGAIEF